ncbi:ribonuclease PH [Candidatus Scalindua japonica]|uniref:dITP/XTP pyrophosphatase n=1 Tax=Candidatus Scalindua japonica TaxID=1284222 RepID=A0A286TUC8_9BACT|nr:XTP/dITP diphosphatase [Candidatus Scalindua japonica]GAX59488.1 ribonuclease PH [Candidatus Scalindua japonica]
MIKTSGIVIGTKNKNKKEEIRKILSGMSLPLLDLEDFNNVPDVIEDGVTFEENAAKKALQLAKFCKLSVMADDSGLEVDALNKRPGVLSSRYCGEDTCYEEKCAKLLEELDGIPVEKRTARFKCAIALAGPEKLHFVVEASCEGFINTELRGEYGFGYDPVFYLSEYNQTMAELSPDVKNRISHRALALGLFKEGLKKFVVNSVH